MFVAFYRTIVFYLLLLVVIRILGKRQLGQMEASEFVVTMIVANLATIPMENPEIPVFQGMIPILTILAAEILISLLSLRSIRFRKLLCGKPVILIENGRVLQKNLRKTRVSVDELTGYLRQKDVLDIAQVQFAILETNGDLSVFPFPKYCPPSARDAGVPTRKQAIPFTIISDGRLIKENLAASGKDASWVQRVLAEKRASLGETWLLTVDREDTVRFYRKEK